MNYYRKLKDANYKYIKFLGNKEYLLKDLETGRFEIWISNENHASFGLIYRNIHLEFARTQLLQSYCAVNDCEICKI